MAPCISFYCCIRISHECKSLTKSISSLIFSVGEEARCDQTRSTLGLSKIINEVLTREAVSRSTWRGVDLGLQNRNKDLGFLMIAGQRPLSVSGDCLQLLACGLPDTRSPGSQEVG